MFFRSAQRQLDMAAFTAAAQASTTSAEALGKIDRHEDDCRKYREAMRRELTDHRVDVNDRFDKQDEDRAKMHAENQQKFDRLFRALYIATGVLLAASMLMGHGEVGELVKIFAK